jgi:hypothetical protein
MMIAFRRAILRSVSVGCHQPGKCSIGPVSRAGHGLLTAEHDIAAISRSNENHRSLDLCLKLRAGS